MSQFLEKSNESLSSADILIKQQYYSSTVNRAYYGYFQFLMHTLFYKLEQDREQFDIASNKNNEGSHVRASNLILVLIQTKVTNSKYKWFQATIKELKKKRNFADYSDIEITPDDGTNSIKWANALIDCVEQNIK